MATVPLGGQTTSDTQPPNERSVYTGLLEEGLMSLGFVLLVAALLGGLMLAERRTFARMFALDDRRRERERRMWEEYDDDGSDDGSSSEQDDEYQRERLRRGDVVRVSWRTEAPRVLSINDDGGGDVRSADEHEEDAPIADPYRVHSVVVSEDGDADGDDEASFAMRRLTNDTAASTRTPDSAWAAGNRQTTHASPSTARRPTSN